MLKWLEIVLSSDNMRGYGEVMVRKCPLNKWLKYGYQIITYDIVIYFEPFNNC